MVCVHARMCVIIETNTFEETIRLWALLIRDLVVTIRYIKVHRVCDWIIFNWICSTDTRSIRLNGIRSEEHTSELQSLMRISYAVFCLKKKTTTQLTNTR